MRLDGNEPSLGDLEPKLPCLLFCSMLTSQTKTRETISVSVSDRAAFKIKDIADYPSFFFVLALMNRSLFVGIHGWFLCSIRAAEESVQQCNRCRGTVSELRIYANAARGSCS